MKSGLILKKDSASWGKYTWFNLSLKSVKRLPYFSFQNNDKYFGCCGSSNLILSSNITQSTTFLPQSLDTTARCRPLYGAHNVKKNPRTALRK